MSDEHAPPKPYRTPAEGLENLNREMTRIGNAFGELGKRFAEMGKVAAEAFKNVSVAVNGVAGMYAENDLELALERIKIQEETNIPMDLESIHDREIIIMARVLAKKKTMPTGPSKRPAFMCPTHTRRLVFSSLNQVWECPEAGCRHSKLPAMDRNETNIIKSAPRLIGKRDEDGDVHWYINYTEEGVLIELPFQMTSQARLGDQVSVSINTSDFVIFDKNGKHLTVQEMDEGTDASEPIDTEETEGQADPAFDNLPH